MINHSYGSALKIFIVILLSLKFTFLYAESSSLVGEGLEKVKSSYCNNCEFLSCLELSNTKCIQIIDEAHALCPPIHIESLNVDMFDPVCNSESFINLSDIPPEKVEACSKFLEF